MPAPSVNELVRDIQGLQHLINDGDAHTIEIPAHGRGWGREIDTPSGKMFLGWFRHRDEEGSLAWGDPTEVKNGEYNVLFYDPYQTPPYISFAKFIEGGQTRIAIPWSAIHSLLSLMNPDTK